MAISKAIRQRVYEKYNGRCAYCGRKIEYKDMQVDHFVAKKRLERRRNGRYFKPYALLPNV